MSQVSPIAVSTPKARDITQRKVLHVGCGPANIEKLHGLFRLGGEPAWQETRLDIDETAKPDVLSSIAHMPTISDATYDAIWSSHNIEHLHQHEVLPAFCEFHRVLNPSGFALLRCPDVLAIAQAIVEYDLDATVYTSPAGPITPLDMLYGHSASVARGNRHMRHHTGFTEKRVTRILYEAGFSMVYTSRRPTFDLWALAMKPGTDVPRLMARINRFGLGLGGG
jgi:SAM-dependent methyltransferase